MSAQELINAWFEAWEKGTFQELPIAENFTHTSPYGIIKGKAAYIDLVAANKDLLTYMICVWAVIGNHLGIVRIIAFRITAFRDWI